MPHRSHPRSGTDNASSPSQRWDQRYRDAVLPNTIAPHELVRTALADIATLAPVLDVACGWGDNGLWLAERGAAATLTDISAVALAGVEARAAEHRLDVTTLGRDLTSEPVPSGPWDAITCTHYLDRQLLPRLGLALRPGGRLVVAIATHTNRERHERPSARFLLEPGELATLVPALDIIDSSEGWRRNNTHEAWLVATTRPRE